MSNDDKIQHSLVSTCAHVTKLNAQAHMHAASTGTRRTSGANLNTRPVAHRQSMIGNIVPSLLASTACSCRFWAFRPFGANLCVVCTHHVHASRARTR